MPITRNFKIPDYYNSFACKCGDCKNTCCHGWAITLSMAEYFRLSGMECSEELRRSLDSALIMLDRPTKERYATFNTDWRGDCKLHRVSDGLCAIHRECGEDVLPAICRMYPRAVHTRYDDECCCSAGCEAVAEALMARSTQLTFTEQMLTVPLEPEQSVRTGPAAKLYRPVRKKCIEILQQSSYQLERRLDAIAVLTAELEEVLKSSEDAESYTPQDALYYIEETDDEAEPFDLSSAKLLTNWFGEHSYSLQPYAEAAAKYYRTDFEVTSYIADYELTSQLYEEACAHRNSFDFALENLLVNEVFISEFPFNSDSPTDASQALKALYLILRYVTAPFIDSTFAVFRVADNTSFYSSAPRLMKLIEAERAIKQK